MKRTSALCALMTLCICGAVSAGLVEMAYKSQQLSANRWQYTYTIQNNSLAQGIRAFTIWFDEALYANLSIESPAAISQDWDEIIAQPDALLADDGFYDVLETGAAILMGQSVTGFSVGFDWLGQDVPTCQSFEVFNPTDYSQPVATGTTIPEPAALSLLTAGALFLRRKRNKIICSVLQIARS